MDWPVASVLLGTIGTLAVGILKWVPRRSDAGGGPRFARATDMAEIRGRLGSLEQAHQMMRSELRADIRELQQLLLQALGK